MLLTLICAALASSEAPEETAEPAPSFRSGALAPAGSPARLPPFSPSNTAQHAEDIALIQAAIDDYSRRASGVFVGEVLSTFHPGGQAVQGTEVMVSVSEVLRGSPGPLVQVHVPPAGAYVSGDPNTIPVDIVQGYHMLVFTDQHGEALENQALFFVEGGFLWRNKSPDAFVNPRNDREWSAVIDPGEDYLVYPLGMVRESVMQSSR